MKLCLSLLKDELPFPSDSRGLEALPTISRYAFFRQGMPLSNELMYLAYAEDIPKTPEFGSGTAFACIGDPFEGTCPPLASLLVFPPEVDLLDLANELGCIFQKYHELEDALDEALQAGCGLQELVDIMAPHVPNELTIADSNHLILARSHERGLTPVRSGVGSDHGEQVLPVEVIGFFTNNKRWVETRAETEPFMYDEGIFDHRLLCLNIIIEATFDCRVMMAETEQPFRPYDDYLLTFFAEYVRKAYERSFVSKEHRKVNALQGVLSMLLSDAEVEPWKVHQVFSAMEYEKDARFICLCVRPEYWDDSANTITYYCEQIGKLFPGTVAIESCGSIACLVCLEQHRSPVDSFLNTAIPFMRDNNFRMGVSEVFADLMLFKDYYRQSEIALICGLEEMPSQWVHRFSEQAVSYILKQTGKENGIRTLCAASALILHEYDQANQASYVLTMERYLSNSLSIVRSAADLAIHRATMIYRLKRIKEIAGIDFLDSDKNLFYHLSAKMLILMGK